MQVQPIKPLSFGYKNRLKTEWLKGKLPELKHDFYDGSLLQKDTITLEHIQPKSKGGKTTLTNLVLTNYNNNMRRGNRDIRQYINKEAARKYLEEASKIKTHDIDGEKYAKSLFNKLRSMGVDLLC